MTQRRIPSSVQQHKVRRVACYVRVSTEDQVSNGHGLDAQIQRCQAMAMVKGWPTPTVYRDEGFSGTTMYCSELDQLLLDIRNGKIDAVIISALDRLGRATRLVLDLVEKLTVNGTLLVSCRETIDTSTLIGQFVLTIFAALTQLERDTTADRTRDVLAAKKIKQGYRGGRIPYGYKYDPSSEQITVDPIAADILRRIFSWRKQGRSLRDIADALNAQGIASPQKAGTWKHSSVKAILDNEDMYRGGFMGNSEIRWSDILEEGGDEVSE